MLLGNIAVKQQFLNLWVTTPLKSQMTFAQGSTKIIRKHRYLHYDSQQWQNDSYEVATKNKFMVGGYHKLRNCVKGWQPLESWDH